MAGRPPRRRGSSVLLTAPIPNGGRVGASPEDGLTKIRGYDPPRLGPDGLKAALETLGRAWGLDRPLHNSEIARALRLQGRDPGRSVQAWITGETPISGPAAVAIEMMLAGALPLLAAGPAGPVSKRRFVGRTK